MKRIIIVDDLDGSTDDVQEVKLGLDGRTYALDLSREHREQLADVLRPYIDAAGASKTPPKQRRRRPAASSD